MGNITSKSPPLTEKNTPDLTGKVYIVTGSNTGVGAELAQILYQHNAKIYIAARSEEKALIAIKDIESRHPQSKGSLVFLHLDLNDLTGIKKSAEEFLAKETKLDVLFNNAGVMVPPQGSLTKQNYELQLGVNNVAPFLFTKLLTPLLVETAKTEPEGSVRVVWVSSAAAAGFSPPGGVVMGNLDYHEKQTAWHKYGVSKAGNILHASEFARRFGGQGVISVSANPGNLKTDLYQHLPGWQHFVVDRILKEPIWGAYSELYAGLSPDITAKHNGAFIAPWGHISTPRVDIAQSCKSKHEGGTGVAAEFWEWSEKEVEQFV